MEEETVVPHITQGPAALSVQIRQVRSELAKNGYALVRCLTNQAAAEQFLRNIGDIIPQDNGLFVHDVIYRQENDNRSYSQSSNTIHVHTEAPGWDPSPAYVALFCHRQARCGGGHTDLLDIQRLVTALDSADLALLIEEELTFPGPDGGIRTTILRTDASGRAVTRFSYNLLTTGYYNPPIGPHGDADSLPLGNVGRDLAYRVRDLFQELRTSVLIPENALLLWDNQRMLHARSQYKDRARHLARFWCAERRPYER
jgi:Taurine catabolism dioxygenase TauD, TfdA family